jgi:putative ABC transport system substrate-binding protein
MRRREFIAGLGSAAAWPMVARAQQAERMRRVGVLVNLSENDAKAQKFVTAFRQRLQQLGWVDGGNARIEILWTAGDPERFRKYAAELVALAPDVILASTTSAVVPLLQTTQTIPIIFVGVIDPVGSGIIQSMARPGGNVTGFTLFEYAIAKKWLELLKELAPQVTRVAVLRDSSIAAGIGQFAAIQVAAAGIGAELSAIDLHDTEGIRTAISTFSGTPNGGLIVTASPFGANHAAMITELAGKYRLPSVYPFEYFAEAGGLVSYGPDLGDHYVLAAGYVDRILKGEKASDLPVQAPTKYHLKLNAKTARALGLTIPPTLLARADEVIE